MSLNRYAKRRDSNEPDIVKDLRKCGLLVRQQDFPDLVVRSPSWPISRCALFEVDGITKNRKRSEKQLRFINDWKILLVKSADEVLASLGFVSQPPITSVSCLSQPHGSSTASVGIR